MKAVHGLFHQAVGIGHTLVLAQMLHPGLDQKGFQDAPGFGGILEYTPGIGTIAAPLVLELRQCFEEGLAVRRANTVFDRDQDRTAIPRDCLW